MSSITAAITSALEHGKLSQRTLAEKTGISQPTLNRILTGAREAKLPEIILIADATGCTVAQLTGTGVIQRVECVARATNGSSMETMRQRLLHFMELDAYLDDQAIAAP